MDHLGADSAAGVLVEGANAEAHGGVELIERDKLSDGHRAGAVLEQQRRASINGRWSGGAAPEARDGEAAAARDGAESCVARCWGSWRGKGRQQPPRRRHGSALGGCWLVGWEMELFPPQLPASAPESMRRHKMERFTGTRYSIPTGNYPLGNGFG